jgi:3-hydroxy-3-methylglutaryl CoA synthase
LNSSRVGIQSFGAFIPRLRMSRAAIAEAHAWALPGLKAQAKGERALCSWDEDTITLAVDAARDCLGSELSASAVTLASTTAPFADLQNATIIASALNLPANTPCTDLSGSTRAGLAALAQSLESGQADGRLVVAADRRSAKPGSVQELQYGAGAAALLIGTDHLLARYLGRESLSVPFISQFRASGEKYDYTWEERWIRDEGVSRIVPSAVKTLLQRLQLAPERIAWFGLSGVPSGGDKLAAKLLGIAPERIIPDLMDRVGETGTAHAPLLLINALEQGKPGDIVVVAAFGQGCEVLAFEITGDGRRPARGLAGSLAARVAETSYPKMATFAGELNLDWGPRAEVDIKAALTQQYRAADQILGFVGGRCSACAAVQFPRLPACVNCGAIDSQTPFRLADAPAQIATFSADWLQYYPAPPLYVGLVQFDVGARVLMEIVGVGPQGIDVGTRLSMSFRIKTHDKRRNYSRYFWKAVPQD